MKLNFNFSGKTLLKDWWKIVRDNFTAIQTDHNTLSDKLDTEITQRTNADVGLANQITAETKARESTDSSLSSRINNEVTIRQAADNELQRNIDSEITERQTADSKKADKTELYGTDETTKHTVTYSLTAADMAVSIDAGHSTGTVTVAGNTVKSKILLDGYSIQAADLSATFGCGKGEDGDKYICIYYSPETGTLTMTVEDVETSPEEGTVALMTVGYNTATVTTMYNRAQTFTGINNLNGLKTDNKNSFLEAVNEISTKLTTEISDREDAEHSLTEKISTEISDRQAADNELKAKISEINTELTTDNLFYDLSKYVNSDNKLVTDDSGVQYLSYSGSFENGTYLYHNFVVDNFRRKPKTETALELTFNVASRHIAGDGCDIGGLNIGETDVLITYTDTTTETFGQSYYTTTDTGDKTITINGTSETYKTTKFKIEIPVTKEIKSISFRIVSDNFYTNGDPTGNACEQKTLIQSAVCYDDECVAVLRDDINTNTSKITANTTKITEIDKTVTDISKNQIFVVCDGDHDELKIQAALSRAIRGTVVYIMGDCVLTNENTQDSGLVSEFGHYNAILNVGIRVTLDGTYCSSITFKNTNPAARQVIFFLGIMAKLKNINFQEDNTTCTQTSVNPMILFGNSNAIVDNCVLGEVYDVNQDDSTVGNIIMCSGSKFTNNVIDSWGLKTKTNTGSCMKFSGVFVDNNKFTNIWTTDNSESGYLMSVLSSTFINNVFEDNTVPQGEIYFSGNKSLCYHNIFNSSDIGNITLAGNTANNVFISLDLNERIAVRLRSICNDNTFLGLKVKEGDCAFDLGIESTFANNYIKNLSIITTDSTEGKEYNILYANKAFCRDNVILLSAATNALENLYVIEANASSVVTGNVTSASSIGRLDEGCVAEGNTVAWS
nr:MAG TPA: hypothetical protein [Caudoviricetes sp.]